MEVQELSAVESIEEEVSADTAATEPAAEAEETAAAVLALRSDLLRFITRSTRDRWGVLVVSLDRGDTLFAFRPDDALTPASNLKLFTTAAALHYLGAGYRYGTYVVSSAPLEAGTLDGDLWLYGTGDPSIAGLFHSDDRDVWRALADTLWGSGVREVRGDVVGDASYFQSPWVPQGWQDGYRSADYAAPAGALSYHENTVSLRIRPGSEPGARPEVDYIPGGRGIAVVNLATTTVSGRSRIRVERLAYDGPIVIDGQIPRGHSAIWREVPVADPARYAAVVFREMLEERGIRVHGSVRTLEDPMQSPFGGERRTFAPAFQDLAVPRVLAVHTSPPLHDILTIINHKSHNQVAEQVLLTIGRVVRGRPAAEEGPRALYAFLEEVVGVRAAEQGVRIYDGSGLSVLNRVSPVAVIAVLSYMAESPQWRDYEATLPLAGTRQGLRRMYDTPAQDNLRAKTGTIRNVSALSGYVRASNGERLGFSIMANDVPSTWVAKGIENRIGVELARFTRPAPAEVIPRLADHPPPQAPADDDSASAGPIRVDTLVAERPADPTVAVEDSTAPRSHTIRPGDTLDAIAKRYGVSVSALREANPGLNPRRLIPGRAVALPPDA